MNNKLVDGISEDGGHKSPSNINMTGVGPGAAGPVNNGFNGSSTSQTTTNSTIISSDMSNNSGTTGPGNMISSSSAANAVMFRKTGSGI